MEKYDPSQFLNHWRVSAKQSGPSDKKRKSKAGVAFFPFVPQKITVSCVKASWKNILNQYSHISSTPLMDLSVSPSTTPLPPMLSPIKSPQPYIPPFVCQHKPPPQSYIPTPIKKTRIPTSTPTNRTTTLSIPIKPKSSPYLFTKATTSNSINPLSTKAPIVPAKSSTTRKPPAYKSNSLPPKISPIPQKTYESAARQSIKISPLQHFKIPICQSTAAVSMQRSILPPPQHLPVDVSHLDKLQAAFTTPRPTCASVPSTSTVFLNPDTDIPLPPNAPKTAQCSPLPGNSLKFTPPLPPPPTKITQCPPLPGYLQNSTQPLAPITPTCPPLPAYFTLLPPPPPPPTTSSATPSRKRKRGCRAGKIVQLKRFLQAQREQKLKSIAPTSICASHS